MYRNHYISDVKPGKGIKVAGWVHEIRDKGKLKFVILRDKTGLLQIVLKTGVVPDKLMALQFNKEDVVCFEGEVKESKIAPGGMEMVPTDGEILNKVQLQLPVDPTDLVPSEFDTKLDYRYIDLRRAQTTAIFNIKSTVANAFRSYLYSKGFTEIQTSAITGAATEGGADVFQLKYFETNAYLVQSPQLYKQLAVIGGFDKVFMTVPVFRAEKHNTTTHLNEVFQMDVEIGFADHNEAMDVLEAVVLSMLSEVQEKNGKDLKTLGVEVKIPKKVPRYSYAELIEKLQKAGDPIKWGHDFSKENEKQMYEILGEDLFFIYDWPTEIRAFYSMPTTDPKICHAFDLMYKGLEISSGAMRIHKPEILEDQIRKRGLKVEDFKFYLDAFKLGAPPHAGWSIGLERFTMKLCNLENIRQATLFPRDRTRLHP
ncbi:MAG: aspartate--tRNA(Asn) ligase [Candidatus Micrarchaeota archaeon]